MPWLIIFLFLLAFSLFWIASRQRKAAGIPSGRLIFSDTNTWESVEKPLYAAALGLTGKPDYLIQKKGEIIPVEVKTSLPRQGPYDAHIYQLAAYCLLVTHVFGKRPPYGILHYTGKNQRGQSYLIPFSKELEFAVLETLQEMQAISLRKGIDRSHEQAMRCSRCGYRNTCDQKLAG